METRKRGGQTLSQIRKYKIYYDIPAQSEENHAYDIIRHDCYGRGKCMYKNEDFFSSRLEEELSFIREKRKSFELRLISEIVRFSESKGYPVMWRSGALPKGSIILYLLDFSEINPLPPHYRCPKCRYVEQYSGKDYVDGFDLPDKKCPLCAGMMVKDGHDIKVDLTQHQFWKYPTVLGISKSIMRGLQKHIDYLFGTFGPIQPPVDCIHLQNEEKCKKWRKAKRRLGHCWSSEMYGDKKFLKKVLDNYVDDRMCGLEDNHQDMAFWKSLKKMEEVNFGTLVRIWGYIRIHREKHFEDLFNRNTHTFLEECSEEERRKLHGTGLYASKAVCVSSVMERCFEVMIDDKTFFNKWRY